ncbi:MAG: YHS domain protein [Alphaproteobacteria bacterium]|nr:YHS domain protein [Alphaproteobacteria bacterium]MBL6954940.1 YHS domain protein [Alphaproteobacteria bacterium]
MLAKKSILTALALAMALFVTAPAGAAEAIYSNWQGRAIGGYDPVAYFTDARAMEGKSAFTAKWMGASWRFTSAANRDLFMAMPEKYAPKYGGYCAYAVSQGYTAKIDPTAWSIVEGKLYLNYSHDVQKTWVAKRDAYIAAADKNWPGVLQ